MIGIPAVNSFEMIYYLFLLLCLTAFAIYDIKHKRVPDLALACFLPYILLSMFFDGTASQLPGLMPAMGMLIGGGTLLFSAMITNGGIGGGDIKLCALLGFVYGPYGIILILFLATIMVMMFGLSFRNQAGHLLHLPFVPFLAVSCCAVTILKF